jgi:subtilisin-like proprotein convertase family protein/uncharacterized protein YvpB
MRLKKNELLYLFSSVVIVLLSLYLFSLPGLAGPSNEIQSGVTGTSTPTIFSPLTKPENISSSSTTSTVSITQAIILTVTQTYLPFDNLSPTDTASPTIFPTETPTPLPTQLLYLPNLFREYFIPTYTPTPAPPLPETHLFCDSLSHPISIPDNNANGVSDDISISDGRVLVNVRLYLDISHSYVGDLVVTLSNQNTNHTITAINRPGLPPYGCSHSDIVAVLDSGAAEPVDDQCASYPHAISGIYRPVETLSIFTGQNVAGTWRLNVSDHYINDTGTLNHWCLETQLSDSTPAPTPTPTPVNLPPSASISGMSGQDQQLKLDCESRSAVDWARPFGFNIDEIDFLNHLPKSDDPNIGFVGNPNGNWGNIPPNDYGVFAPPVANLLHTYGLKASSYKSLNWDDLRAEIASGHPVIVWIIGDNFRNIVNGTPHFYTASSTGNTTIVAPYEHTVILVGYSSSSVTVLNGARLMEVSLSQFLDSWSVLDFMAVLARP